MRTVSKENLPLEILLW